MFQDLEPWRCVVRREILEGVDNEALITEALMRSTNRNFDGLELDDNTVSERDFPQAHRLVYDEIVPRLQDYLTQQFGVRQFVDSYTAWLRVTVGGEGMKLHEHSGALLSSIYYPCASEGSINLVDPRGSACRGYPTDVRNRHFNLFSENPKRDSC